MAKKHSDDEAQVRELLYEATTKCLTAKGFHELTIEDVCRASLVKRSVLYRHFANRDALLSETVLRSSRAALPFIFGSIDEGAPDAKRVSRLLELMVPMFTTPTLNEIGRFNVDWWSWALHSELGLAGFRQIWNEWRERLSDLIGTELGDGVPDDTVTSMASLMLVIYNGLLLHSTLEGTSLDIERIVQLQQYGWEGIIERVKAERAEHGAPEAAGPKKR